jgi:hypothetical protein
LLTFFEANCTGVQMMSFGIKYSIAVKQPPKNARQKSAGITAHFLLIETVLPFFVMLNAQFQPCAARATGATASGPPYGRITVRTIRSSNFSLLFFAAMLLAGLYVIT